MKQAIWPIRLFLLASLITMSIWTILGEYEWKRTVVNDVTGESFGQCEFLNRTQQILFLTFEGFFLGVPIIMSLIWAWKTKDVDESFSEGSWIFVLIFVQLQVCLTGEGHRLIYVISSLTRLQLCPCCRRQLWAFLCSSSYVICPRTGGILGWY